MSWIEDARETHIAVTFVGDDYETCLVCSQPAPCLAIRLADELADMERSRATVVAKCADRVESLKSDVEVLARQRETLWHALEQILHVQLHESMEWETVEQIVKDGPGKFDVLALLEHLDPSPRQVETAEELDALPEDTIVADSDGNAWQMGECISGVPTWREAGSGDHWTSGNVSLPVTVLWTPRGGAVKAELILMDAYTELAKVRRENAELRATIERLEAMCRLAVSDGHATPYLTRLINQAMEARRITANESAFSKVTRVTVVDADFSRAFEHYSLYRNGAELHLQDDGRTLKVLPAKAIEGEQ